MLTIIDECHIISDMTVKDNACYGAYSINFSDIKTCLFESSGYDCGTLSELTVARYALWEAISQFESKKYIVHIDIIDMPNIMEKKWFKKQFDDIIKPNIIFQTDANKYITYKKCHLRARMAAGIYKDLHGVLSNQIWKDERI